MAPRDAKRVKPMEFIYRNLNAAKQGLPSWQYGAKPKQPRKGRDGKPLRHADVYAADVTFRESPPSWRRCLRDALDPTTGKGWDVHAYAVAREIVAGVPAGMPRVAITYDKYGSGRFVRKSDGAALVSCQWVHFAADGHAYALGRIVVE